MKLDEDLKSIIFALTFVKIVMLSAKFTVRNRVGLVLSSENVHQAFYGPFAISIFHRNKVMDVECGVQRFKTILSKWWCWRKLICLQPLTITSVIKLNLQISVQSSP